MRYIKIFLMLAMLSVMVSIFCFSAQPSEESNNVSTEITDKIVDISLSVTGMEQKIEKEELVKNLNGIVRKYAHFTLFAVLGVVSILFFGLGIFGKWNMRVWVFAFLFCVLYAISDEIHQLFVPGRSCEIADALTDWAGSFLGSGIIFICIRKLHTKARKVQK